MTDDRLAESLRCFFPGSVVETQAFDRGPIGTRIPGFNILVVNPRVAAEGWRYFSNGARSVGVHGERCEYLLEAPFRDDVHLETLSMVANFHAKQRYGGVYLGRILDIGKPWIEGSSCDHLLVSMPHTLGPDLEYIPGAPPVRILWLLPITKREADYARSEGVGALEQIFEQAAIDTLAPTRKSAV
jgi:hypothetical protein